MKILHDTRNNYFLWDTYEILRYIDKWNAYHDVVSSVKFDLISVIFLFTKIFIVKLTLGLFLRYSYNLCDFYHDILTDAIPYKKTCNVLENLFDGLSIILSFGNCVLLNIIAVCYSFYLVNEFQNLCFVNLLYLIKE